MVWHRQNAISCDQNATHDSGFYEEHGVAGEFSESKCHALNLAPALFSHIMKERNRLPGPALQLRNQFTISTAF